MAGAKGAAAGERLRASMRRHPELFRKRLEKNMVEALELPEETPQMALTYVTKKVPVERQRALGHLVFLLAHIHTALAKREHERARLLTLLGLAAAEQSCLDQNWKTAWKLTGLEGPPFQEWSQQPLCRRTATPETPDLKQPPMAPNAQAF